MEGREGGHQLQIRLATVGHLLYPLLGVQGLLHHGLPEWSVLDQGGTVRWQTGLVFPGFTVNKFFAGTGPGLPSVFQAMSSRHSVTTDVARVSSLDDLLANQNFNDIRLCN